MGSRAGWIGTGVTASAGQMVVRLTTPDVDSATDAAGSQDYELSGNMSRSRGKLRSLRFRSCGTGCFVAPVKWRDGLNTATLRTSADQWQGGTTAVVVAWPPRPAPKLLSATVRAMRRVGSFTLQEQVTSNTEQGAGEPYQFNLAGREFLDTEPYGSGAAPTVVVLGKRNDETTLALAYPGEGTYVRLTIDAQDHRILRETLTAPKHMITRTFVYR